MSEQEDRPDREIIKKLVFSYTNATEIVDDFFDQIIALVEESKAVKARYINDYIKIVAKEAKREGGRNVMAILKKEYPAIDTWQCWEGLTDSKKGGQNEQR